MIDKLLAIKKMRETRIRDSLRKTKEEIEITKKKIEATKCDLKEHREVRRGMFSNNTLLHQDDFSRFKRLVGDNYTRDHALVEEIATERSKIDAHQIQVTELERSLSDNMKGQEKLKFVLEEYNGQL